MCWLELVVLSREIEVTSESFFLCCEVPTRSNSVLDGLSMSLLLCGPRNDVTEGWRKSFWRLVKTSRFERNVKLSVISIQMIFQRIPRNNWAKRSRIEIEKMIGSSSSKHSFKRSVGMTLSLHREFVEVNANFLISSSVAGLKFCKVGGGETGLVNGSGSVEGGRTWFWCVQFYLWKSREMHLPERWYQDCLKVHHLNSDGALNSMSSLEIED